VSRRRPSQPDSLIYWVDRCLGTRVVPQALEHAGIEIRRYVDLYPNDAEVDDVVWIPEVTARGWIILTQDRAITRNWAEIEVLRRAKARFIALAAAGLSGPKQAACLLKHWRTVEGLLRTRKPPVIAKVLRSEVQWHDGKTWRRAKAKRPK